ncbi:MAG: FAD-dependent oxidoreductase [Chloroflexota bacterium]
MTSEEIKTDILVIGGGGAGSRAAYEAKRLEPGLDVLVAVDGTWGAGGSTVWKASETLGINAPLNAADDGDSPEIFLKDILETGLGLASPSLALIIAHESADRILELIDLGVEFDRSGGKVIQRKLSGCTRARSLSKGGETGVSIVSTLKNASLAQGVRVLESVRVLDLICENGEIWGVRALKQGKPIDILAKAVILANGGAGALFPHNVNHPSLRGDGFAMAYRAGALLTNMEFIQIGPGVVFPKLNFIIHSHMWRFTPRLKNVLGKEFLDEYLPPGLSREQALSLKAMSFPFSARTDARYIDIAMYQEITQGRSTKHGGIFFDVNHVPENQLKEKAPITYQTFLDRGINLCTDVIEIAPLVQNFNGGVKIDENAATTVPGLFAVGEVSGGVHGADRPGGNNLADCQVFGYRGGRAAAALASTRPWKFNGPLPLTELIARRDAKGLSHIREEMDKALMIVRRKEGLLELLGKIRELREKVSVSSIADDNLLLNAEIFAGAALLREESRGTHYRADFPKTDPKDARPSLIRKGKGGEMEACLE